MSYSICIQYLSYFPHCRTIVKTSNYEMTHMESCSNQKSAIKTTIILYLIFFKVPPFTLVTALHTLGILSTSFTWNAFQTVLKEFSHMLSTCWLLILHSVVQLIPNHLNWVEFGWLWRPGHLIQHSITLLLGQIALTQPWGVLGHCHVEKQTTVSVSTNQMGWRIAANVIGHIGHMVSRC